MIRSDIRSSFGDSKGTAEEVPMTLELTILDRGYAVSLVVRVDTRTTPAAGAAPAGGDGSGAPGGPGASGGPGGPPPGSPGGS